MLLYRIGMYVELRSGERGEKRKRGKKEEGKVGSRHVLATSVTSYPAMRTRLRKACVPIN